MTLVEFPNDGVAFDLSEVTSIDQHKTRGRAIATCGAECSKRVKHVRVDGSYTVCDVSSHNEREYFTTITVDGRNLTVRRTFHEVMLVLEAYRLADTAKPC